MVIAHDFRYVRPGSVEEALSALAEPGARVLAGGTDVVPWLHDELIEPELLVDIKSIPGLHGIIRDGRRLRIGAQVTFSDLVESGVIHESTPMLAEMAHQVASVGVRNRATVVGNLCSAVPSLDAGPALLVYDAEVRVAGPEGKRAIQLTEWFVAPRQTRLGRGEMVTAVDLHLPPAPHGAVFVKLARYSGEDLAQANLAILVTSEHDYRVAFGAVAPTPFRSVAIEQVLAGKALDEDLSVAAQSLVASEISPITDLRASAEYRTHMCRVMLRRGLATAVARLSGKGPPYPAQLI